MIAGMIFTALAYIIIILFKRGEVPNVDIILSSISSNILFFFTAFLIGIVSSVLPDILDPPFTYKHRKYAHSVHLLIFLIAVYLFTLYLIYRQMAIEIWGIHFFCVGYISHLVLDSFTPMGLYS